MLSPRKSPDAQGDAVSLVIPVFNEQEALPELIRRCLEACHGLAPFEIVLVDDGSSDGSARLISEAAEQHPGQVVGILLNRNYGQHAAVMAGFAASRGDIIVTLDADLQNPPEEIPRIVEAVRQGHDVVGSVRTRRRDSLFRRLASRLVNRITARVTGVAMSDYGCMLRGYRRSIVAAMLQCQERSTFIPALALGFARTSTEIEVQHAARTSGESKYSLWKLINLQLDLMTTTTKLPLRLLSLAGAAAALLGVGLGVLILALRLIFGPAWAAEGVFTLFAVLFVILGVQLFALGLLGEYLGRVYDDVRARPRYFVHSIAGRSHLPAPKPERGAEDDIIPAGRPAGQTSDQPDEEP
jgi:undecaprenyl-phosphate 4-deoxy-4-formamido-L-arabinose transferase